MQYRPEIDGLRAVAVLAVVFFHLGFDRFSGGYVGVDVFFVISGYLITSLISVKLEAGTFRLADFYGRRIRRLFPPLMVTVALTFVAATVLLYPLDFAPFAKSAVASLFSFSNLVFYSEAGYWDTASELKPLLHTWSLGVEEQFYLLWPALLLVLLGRDRGGRLFAVAAGVFAASFALCIWWTPRDAPAAFYLLPFRMFEFALGALLIPLSRAPRLSGLLRRRPVCDALVVSGLALILWSVLRFDGKTPFPGWLVILPTLGAAFILLATSGSAGAGALGRLLLGNPVSLWLGRVSYSLYLAHWPLVALYLYANARPELTRRDQLVLVCATLTATLFLHYAVENRFYQRSGSATTGWQVRWSAPAIVALSAALALAPLSAWLDGGWNWRSQNALLSAEAIKQGMSARFRLARESCAIASLVSNPQCDLDKPYQVLVFGDSHEPDGYNFLHAIYGDDKDINLIGFGSTSGCPGLSGSGGHYRSFNPACTARFEALFDPGIYARLDLVVYSANRPFSVVKTDHLNVLRDLKALRPDLKIMVMGGYIFNQQPCWRLANLAASVDACKREKNVLFFEDNPAKYVYYRDFMRLSDYFVDRVGLLCPGRQLSQCIVATPEGVPMSYDRHHLSLEFAQYSGRLYEQAHPDFVKELLRKPGVAQTAPDSH